MKTDMKYFLSGLALMCSMSAVAAQYTITSPDGRIKATIDAYAKMEYSVTLDNKAVIAPSSLSMKLADGSLWGPQAKVVRASKKSVDSKVKSPFYRNIEIPEQYNSLTLDCKGNWGVEFRAYNDAVAYRFFAKLKNPVTIADEEVEYSFPSDATAYVPYTKPHQQNRFFNSFENAYAVEPLSKIDTSRLAFLPLTVDLGYAKVTMTESDLENYPGMYLAGDGTTVLRGVFAPYPKKEEQGGHNNLQMIVTESEDYIATGKGKRTFPWRAAVITDNDRDLAATNISYLLAAPSRLTDHSWVKPGKVAWDWWNCWNISGVDFKAGINNDTYKKYIDFAAEKGIEYVILDEGWAVNKKADLMQVVPEIDLEMLVNYAKDKNVGIVLWAGYHAFDRDMENVCRHYADMGVKGFKVDFMDRDDQKVVDFVHRAAQTCAKYNLFLDLHGMFKPAGLNRTYPNILNFEGVNGLEQMKWSSIEDFDQVKYDVQIPFIRQIAGPMDYTPGAMDNGTKRTFHTDYYEPMSQGTRCRQLALFVVFDQPFAMLSDTPDNYRREPECTDFISSVPTVWDETKILQGKMGEYIVVARRHGDKWYVAGLTDWTPRDLTVDLSFLGHGEKEATLFTDGVNAHRNAKDFKQQRISLSKDRKLNIHLAPGGGFAMVM